MEKVYIYTAKILYKFTITVSVFCNIYWEYDSYQKLLVLPSFRHACHVNVSVP